MAKIGALLVCLLFGIIFTAGGIFAGILPIGSTAYAWMQTRNWQPAKAEVIRAELKKLRASKGGSTYLVETEYRYPFGASKTSYTSKRIGLNTIGADNISDWHKQHYEQLNLAKNNRAPISIWVNPANPAEAVLDRDNRWAQVVFSLPFAIGFTLVGLVALGIGWLIFFDPGSKYIPSNKHNKILPHQHWWQTIPEWKNGYVTCSEKSNVMAIWGLAILWGSLAFPIPLLFLLKGNLPGIAMAALLLFPLAGIYLFKLAIKASMIWKRYGDFRLKLEPFPARLGSTLLVTTELPGNDLVNERFIIDLVCQRKDSSGKNTLYETLWKKNWAMLAKAQNGNATLKFDVAIPAKLPQSEPPQRQNHEWLIRIRTDEPTSRFYRSINIPVIQ